MNKTEQKNLIKVICNNNRDWMVEQVTKNKIPQHWDGFEFRHWLEHIAREENIWNRIDYKKSNKARIKDCNNTMIINNI